MHSHEPAEVIKPPLQTEQCKAPLPNSAWALQAVSQLHAVSFICFFQIGFLFNRRKAFILMAPLGLSPGRRATPDSCGMGRDRTLWDRKGQNGTGWLGSSSLHADNHKHQDLPAPSAVQQSTKEQGEICISSFLKSRHPRAIPQATRTVSGVCCGGNQGKKSTE